MKRNMDVLKNLIYEVKHKTKPMALLTCEREKRSQAEKILKQHKLDFFICEIGEKINVYFGQSPCIEIIRTRFNKSLSNLSSEEDFILGIMLGYDRVAQCERFLERSRCFLPQRAMV